MIQINDNTGSACLSSLQAAADRTVSRLRLRGDVTVLIGTDKEARELNQRHRGINAPTDVLSFPIQEELPDGYYCGDIFICLPLAREQARKAGHSVSRELQLLLIHGLLHLAGFDHEIDSGEMERLQEEILDSLPAVADNHQP
ncbi:MAG TPA: rRNA maturation RNase YbeY [Candidatus Aminicenantes bacterium]|nr:rRNA maturation RNase YbeY [Candidatus Aminicenantes bacterium]